MNDVDKDQLISLATELANTVLSMGMVTDKGLHARHLARKIVGVPTGPDHLVAITTNGTTRLVPLDEPVFLLRGQDACGYLAAYAWAAYAEANGADPAILSTARAHAAKMKAWPKKKIPDLPPSAFDVIGENEGETCGRDGCTGTIELREREGCSCHTSPPCNSCVEPREFCATCDWDARND